MRRHDSTARWVLVAMLIATTGCQPQQPFYFSQKNANPAHYVDVGTEIEYPDVESCSLDEVRGAKPPMTLDNPKPEQTWDLTLEEAVRIALANATVLRNGLVGDVGAFRVPDTIQRAPFQVVTVYNPAQQESDPRTGVEGALAAFDAQFAATVGWDRVDQPQNVPTSSFFSAFQPSVLRQDLGSFQSQISKFNATGAQTAIRHNVNYDWSNVTFRQFPSAWTTNVEAEITQPFLRGAGVAYNRIAGPGAIPGFFNGVMIARLRTDQSLADFEANVRNLVNDVERAYWSLYYSYRRLDAAIAGRDASLQTWRTVWAKFQLGARGGSAHEEAEARQQYFTFRAAVEQAFSGLYEQESVLRYMMGLTSSDGRVIRTADEPTTAKVDFDWYQTHSEALVRSPELRRQKWVIKQRELELIASKNWLLPQLNGVARYRWLGLGDTLIDPENNRSNAYGSMTSGEFQEWHLGLELQFPFGFRREMAGVRNAQLNLIRDRKVLQEQELELTHSLAEAVRDLSQNYQLAQTYYNQLVAAKREVAAASALWEAGATVEGQQISALDLLLQAQRRQADAEDRYYQSLARYNVSIEGVHFRKGSLLEYNGVYLAEGPWPAKAYFDAARRAKQRDAAHYIDYGFTMPRVVSQGPYNQQAGAPEGVPGETMPLPGESILPPGAPEAEPIPAGEPAPLPLPSRPRSAASGTGMENGAPSSSPRYVPGVQSPERRGPRLQPRSEANVLRGQSTVAKASPAVPAATAAERPEMKAKQTATTGWTAPRSQSPDAASAVRQVSYEQPAPSDGWKKPNR